MWDAPNIDVCLSEVTGQRPTAATRPDMEAVIRWLQHRGSEGETLEACVFANLPKGLELQMASWVATLRHQGWSVFVKPKRRRRDDVDPEMVSHAQRRFRQGNLVELIVASHDGRAFAAPLAALAAEGLPVTVVGFRERAAFAVDLPGVTFLDLEEISGVFSRPLPRTNLFDLPAGGRWFEPFVPLAPRAPTATKDEAPAGPAPIAAAGPESAHGDVAAVEAKTEPPEEDLDRGQVVAVVAAAVVDAAAAGRPGMALQEVGELLRTRHPGFALAHAGFGGVGELLDALTASGRVGVFRTPEGGHVLVPAGFEPAAAAPAPQPDRQPGETDPVRTLPLPADQPADPGAHGVTGMENGHGGDDHAGPAVPEERSAVQPPPSPPPPPAPPLPTPSEEERAADTTDSGAFPPEAFPAETAAFEPGAEQGGEEGTGARSADHVQEVEGTGERTGDGTNAIYRLFGYRPGTASV